MKRILSSFLAPLIYLLSPAVFPVFAQNPTIVAPNINPCPANNVQFLTLCIPANQLAVLVRNGLNIIVLIAVLVAVGYLIYGGIRWVISRGDKTEVESARNHIVAAIVGLIIVFLAFFIIQVILKVFGIQNAMDLNLIQLVPSPTQ